MSVTFVFTVALLNDTVVFKIFQSRMLVCLQTNNDLQSDSYLQYVNFLFSLVCLDNTTEIMPDQICSQRVSFYLVTDFYSDFLHLLLTVYAFSSF